MINKIFDFYYRGINLNELSSSKLDFLDVLIENNKSSQDKYIEEEIYLGITPQEVISSFFLIKFEEESGIKIPTKEKEEILINLDWYDNNDISLIKLCNN
jgi:hypothetical protein